MLGDLWVVFKMIWFDFVFGFTSFQLVDLTEAESPFLHFWTEEESLLQAQVGTCCEEHNFNRMATGPNFTALLNNQFCV